MPSVTTLCGLHPRKGVPDLLAAFRLLRPEFPNWLFNIIGYGPDLPILVVSRYRRAREAGCVIVATAVGGTLELLARGDAGELVEPGSARPIAKALRGLMQEEEVLRQ